MGFFNEMPNCIYKMNHHTVLLSLKHILVFYLNILHNLRIPVQILSLHDLDGDVAARVFERSAQVDFGSVPRRSASENMDVKIEKMMTLIDGGGRP